MKTEITENQEENHETYPEIVLLRDLKSLRVEFERIRLSSVSGIEIEMNQALEVIISRMNLLESALVILKEFR
jgi:hypothetical protein